MMHAAPAALPRHAAAIVRLLSDQNTSGRATWNVVVRKDGTRYRLDYAWRKSNEVSIHVVDGKRELWAATKGSKAEYVCSRTAPAKTASCQANPTVSQVTPIFLAFSWFFDPTYLGKQFSKASDKTVTRATRSGLPVACLHQAVSSACVTSFGAPAVLVTPQVKLTATSMKATPSASDFAKPKTTPAQSAPTASPALGLYA
jgi:hypothetical protein